MLEEGEGRVFKNIFKKKNNAVSNKYKCCTYML